MRPPIVALLSSPLMLWGSLDRALAAPTLTIYNDNFAVVREEVPLALKKGVNELRFSEITGFAEPSSVMLRDPKGKTQFRILEQNYRGDMSSQSRLIEAHIGKELEFLVPPRGNEPEKIVTGKLLRAAVAQSHEVVYGRAVLRLAQPEIVEVAGKVRFGLPGTPIFPPLNSDSILKPRVEWLIASDDALRLNAELAYVTRQISWSADYNMVADEGSEKSDLTAWVTISNRSGRSFPEARLKLMAGDVNKSPDGNPATGRTMGFEGLPHSLKSGKPTVTEKPFDDYHLYTLARPVTLHDDETKQVEFVRAESIRTRRKYIYDGVRIPQNYLHYDALNIRGLNEYGTLSNPKVWVVREFENTKKNGLGIPLPAGKVRFYARDSDGRLELTGENRIDHTPGEETLRIYTGNAFDLVGERKRVHFFTNSNERLIQEKFEIELRNGGDKPARLTVVEHLYRWTNWEISQNSRPFKKVESQTVEFEVEIKPKGSEKVAYSVAYTW